MRGVPRPPMATGGLRSENRSSTYTPIATRIAAISGAACSVDSDDSTVAPRNAPIAPGTPNFSTIGQSMFLNRQCDNPGRERGADLREVHGRAGLRGAESA